MVKNSQTSPVSKKNGQENPKNSQLPSPTTYNHQTHFNQLIAFTGRRRTQ
jgi:hypothetical protein